MGPSPLAGKAMAGKAPSALGSAVDAAAAAWLTGRARTETETAKPAAMVAPGVVLAFDTAVTKLEAQRRDLDALDAKTAPLVALLGIATGGFVAAARTPVERIGGAVLLTLAILGTLYAFFIRDVADAPKPETFAAFAGYSPEEMKEQFLSAATEAVKENRAIRRRKVLGLKVALIAIGLLALLILLVVGADFDSRLSLVRPGGTLAA